MAFDRTVFINCPFDEAYEPLLEATLFCCVLLGFSPVLATVSVDSGQNRLSKIMQQISSAKYSIHDLSRTKANKEGDVFRMNMPFEFGVDYGLRHSGIRKFKDKKFLVFEFHRFDLKPALSDLAGQDVEHHSGYYDEVIRHIRNFFKTEADVDAEGPSKIMAKYENYQAWLVTKKMQEGHSEADIRKLPMPERIEEIHNWIAAGTPNDFDG